jgi:hypothetical protein
MATRSAAGAGATVGGGSVVQLTLAKANIPQL